MPCKCNDMKWNWDRARREIKVFVTLACQDSEGISREMDQHTENSILRKRYLGVMMKIRGQACELKCHERTDLSGTYQTIAPTSDFVILSDVKTPTEVVPSCAVRQGDIICMSVGNPWSQASSAMRQCPASSDCTTKQTGEWSRT